jgi:hypothetical protein
MSFNRMTINKLRIYYGGDMPSIGELIGLSGHSGIYFCNNCLCQKQQLQRKLNIIHALDIPPSLISHGFTAMGPIQHRTLALINHSHQQFIIEADGKLSAAQQYYNCVRPCLVTTEIDNHLVPTPLHITMGVTERLIASMEKKCKEWKQTDQFADVLHRHNVRRSAQFGGHFTGDAAIRFFGSITTCKNLINAPSDNDKQWFDMWVTLVTMGQISHLINRPTPLCSHEITSLHSLCNELAWQWYVHYETRVFPKLHVLSIDIPQFARQHHTVLSLSLSLSVSLTHSLVYMYIYILGWYDE